MDSPAPPSTAIPAAELAKLPVTRTFTATEASIAADILGQMDAPSQHAIDAHNLAEAQRAEQVEEHRGDSGLRDRKGRSFDPEIHTVDASGNPALNKNGTLKIKPFGGKPGAARGNHSPKRERNRPTAANPSAVNPSSQVGGPDSVVGESPAARQAAEQQARMGGKFAAHTLIMLGVTLGGEEWKPAADTTTGLDERALLESAFGDYFVAKEMSDIPPGVALAIVIGGYIAPRLTQPQTRTRLGRARDWCKARWFAWRGRKAPKKAKESSHEKSDQPDLRVATG